MSITPQLFVPQAFLARPRVDIVFKEDAGNEASPAKILPSSNSPRKDTEQAKTP